MELATVLAEDMHRWGGHEGWWLLFPILWFVLIGSAIFFFIARGRRAHYHRSYGSGESVLAERYARGEISEQEYRDRLAVLKDRSR